jgi:hypothetical protein
MEAVCSSETLADFYRTTRCYIQETALFTVTAPKNLKSNWKCIALIPLLRLYLAALQDVTNNLINVWWQQMAFLKEREAKFTHTFILFVSCQLICLIEWKRFYLVQSDTITRIPYLISKLSYFLYTSSVWWGSSYFSVFTHAYFLSDDEGKAIPVTGRGGPKDCEMLRIPHCLDSRLIVNCEILATCSSTYSPVRTSQETHYVSIK